MRIGAGEFKGRRLPQVRGQRPASARLKTSLFSVLAARLPGARVLDLCAGVGGLGLEALSRGAASLALVDLDRAAVAALQAWLQEAGAASRARALRADWLKGPLPDGPFDLIFLDPPYPQWGDEAAVARGVADLATRLAEGGVLVTKRPARLGAWPYVGWGSLRSKVVASVLYDVLEPNGGGVQGEVKGGEQVSDP